MTNDKQQTLKKKIHEREAPIIKSSYTNSGRRSKQHPKISARLPHQGMGIAQEKLADNAARPKTKTLHQTPELHRKTKDHKKRKNQGNRRRITQRTITRKKKKKKGVEGKGQSSAVTKRSPAEK